MEMTSFNDPGAGPNTLLDECRAIDQEITAAERNIDQIRLLQNQSLSDAEGANSYASQHLETLSSETMDLYRRLTQRVRELKSRPEAQQARYAGQVSRVDKRLKDAINQYHGAQATFRQKTQEQMARQYRIVRPDAGEDEVRAAVEDGGYGAGGQVFSEALMQSTRQGQARAALSAVRDRHAQVRKIEDQMVELARLFEEMDMLVQQQDYAVQRIEESGEQAVDNLERGNQEVKVAVKKAWSARRKKWWCLGICGASMLIMLILRLSRFVSIQKGDMANLASFQFLSSSLSSRLSSSILEVSCKAIQPFCAS